MSPRQYITDMFRAIFGEGVTVVFDFDNEITHVDVAGRGRWSMQAGSDDDEWRFTNPASDIVVNFPFEDE